MSTKVNPRAAIKNTKYRRTGKKDRPSSASLAHALLEPLHHLLVRRHPRPPLTIFPLMCWRETERFAPGIADDICVGLGAQRWAVDYTENGRRNLLQ